MTNEQERQAIRRMLHRYGCELLRRRIIDHQWDEEIDALLQGDSVECHMTITFGSEVTIIINALLEKEPWAEEQLQRIHEEQHV